MINTSSVYSVFTVFPEVQHCFHTHVFRLWPLCFCTSHPCCSHLFFSLLLLLLPSLPLTTGCRVHHWGKLVCRLDRGWLVQDLWEHQSYLARSHKVCAGCKENVDDLNLLLVKKDANQWIGVAAKSLHVYLWLLFLDERCNFSEHSCMDLNRLLFLPKLVENAFKVLNFYI